MKFIKIFLAISLVFASSISRAEKEVVSFELIEKIFDAKSASECLQVATLFQLDIEAEYKGKTLAASDQEVLDYVRSMVNNFSGIVNYFKKEKKQNSLVEKADKNYKHQLKKMSLEQRLEAQKNCHQKLYSMRPATTSASTAQTQTPPKPEPPPKPQFNALELALNPFGGTKAMMDDFKDEGGLNRLNSWYGVYVQGYSYSYDGQKNVSRIVVNGSSSTSMKHLREIASSFCGFSSEEWTRQDFSPSDRVTGKAENDKCFAMYDNFVNGPGFVSLEIRRK